eukprot:jgi/Mesvir1/19863/Mv13153-RA.1
MSFQKSEIEATGQTVGLFYLGLTETNFDMFRLSVNVAWFAGAPGTIKLTLPADLAPVDAEGFSNERTQLYKLLTNNVSSNDVKWELEYDPGALQGPIGAAGAGAQSNVLPVIGSVALPGANPLSTRARMTSAYIVP